MQHGMGAPPGRAHLCIVREQVPQLGDCILAILGQDAVCDALQVLLHSLSLTLAWAKVPSGRL